jgi:hypothetical protein
MPPTKFATHGSPDQYVRFCTRDGLSTAVDNDSARPISHRGAFCRLG